MFVQIKKQKKTKKIPITGFDYIKRKMHYNNH